MSTSLRAYYSVTIEGQVRRSDGIIVGQFKENQYKKVHTGEVITEAIFYVDYAAGIMGNHMINPESFKIIIPGGKWQSLVYKSPNEAKFEKGQRYALILKKGKFGYRLLNKKYSSFNLEGGDLNRYFITSDYLPRRNGMGKSEWNRFVQIVGERYQRGFLSMASGRFNQDMLVHTFNLKKKKKKRSPASQTSQERAPASQGGGQLGMLWIILSFGALGAFSGKFLKEERKDS